MFLVFEGIDGSGKTTQAKLLYDYLKRRGVKVLLTKEPTKSPIGRLIKKFFLYGRTDEPLVDALLFSADTVLHVDSEIKPLLSKNYVVISDRYIYSTIAYQSGRNVSVDYLLALHKDTIKPDIVFLIDSEPERSIKRVKQVKKKLTKYENEAFLKKVRQNYLTLKSRVSSKVVVLSDTLGIKKIHEKVVSEVNKLL